MHLVPRCNYDCVFCYVPFAAFDPRDLLSVDAVARLLAELAAHGVRKVTFAGGEPTLHPRLADLLRLTAETGLVPSLVTNGRRIDEAWFDAHGPWLRWLALSFDSIQDEISDQLGRRLKGRAGGHLAHVQRVCTWLHAWNVVRPLERRLRLKLNVVVTALNAHEDAVPFIRRCHPERLKLLQLLLVAGENDRAAGLSCSDAEFLGYSARTQALRDEGVEVVSENNDDMAGSYLMIDPRGQLFQRRDGGYVTSSPILDVGLLEALRQVGGVDRERFVGRGGDYDSGTVPTGNRPYLVAIEGLDGSGKSTVARRLTERLEATLVENPPRGWKTERTAADRADEVTRRAFYLRGNRAATAEAEATLSSGRPVVMDRSAASTLAFGEATAGRVAAASSWPADLRRPDLLVLLNVPEDVRLERIAGRQTWTTEERTLAADGAFRRRVLEGYAAFGAIEIDARRPVEAVVDEVIGLVRAGTTTTGGRQ
jgi:radical S-adenosyl methionine domain-containing protein 2